MTVKLIQAFCLLIFCVLSSQLSAQKYTINGHVTDGQTGETLIGANIFDLKSNSGTTSNNYGFYSLTLPTDSVYLAVSYVGYKTSLIAFALTKDEKLNVDLAPSIDLGVVEVIASQSEETADRETQMSTVRLSVKEIEKLPAFLGETDILKALQLLPGIQSGSEGQSGFYVRGGSPDQNLILLDGVPVYNASHLFGFFSVFNSDAIKDVKLIKGGFPARYGGRLSSVLDINMKEGNKKELKGAGSIGLMAAKFTLEGPLGSEKTSFIVSGRRTYIDLLSRPIITKALKDQNSDGKVGYFFHDFNAKINHTFSDKDRLYLSVYNGLDKFYFDVTDKFSDGSYRQEIGLGWGNLTSALRYNRIWGKRLFSNLTLTYSRYNFNTKGGEENIIIEEDETIKDLFSLGYDSGIKDLAAKIDFDFTPNPRHRLRFGGNITAHDFNPGTFEVKNQTADIAIDTVFGQESVKAIETAMYLEDNFEITDKLEVNAGVHFSTFSKEKGIYTSLQPRLGLRYLLPEGAALKASFTTMQQYIQFLTNENLGLPTDLWLPTTDRIKPQRSMQFALGYVKDFNREYEFSAEGYYKKITNVLSYKEGASFINFGNWEDNVTQGKGEAYGTELLFRKKQGKLTGWVGYTLNWTNRQFDDINQGKKYPFKYDRRHDISIVGMYEINERISVSASWVFGSGNAYTLGEGRFVGIFPQGSSNNGIARQFLTSFGENRNNFRTPNYHRLDASISFTKQKKLWERTWSFGFYNMYNRANPFLLLLGSEPANNGGADKPVIRQISIFPVLPYFNWSFNF